MIPAIMQLPPPVPIKTYRWEDLRRARARGGYPWTHLDKPPLDSDAWKYMRYVIRHYYGCGPTNSAMQQHVTGKKREE